MPSIVSQLGQDIGDEVAEALEEAGRDAGLPYNRSLPLPLHEVEWALAVADGELEATETWPPARFGARQERLQLYHDLWRGDLTRLMDTRLLTDNSVGPLNVFRRLTRFVADLLVREPATTGQEEGPLADGAVTRLAHSVVGDAIRYGAAYVLSTSINGTPWLRAVDARYVYPKATGGWLIVEPRITAASVNPTPDALQVIEITNGSATISFREGTPTGISDTYSVGPVTGAAALGAAALLPAFSLPEQAEGVIGTSWYDDLITIVIEQARRKAFNTRTLDQNADPFLLMRGNVENYTVLPGVPASSAVRPSDAGQILRSAAVTKRLRQAGPLLLPDGIETAEYVTWDGALEASYSYFDELAREFRFLSGLPAALDSDTEIPSGMSLRRMFWQFDASVAPVYREAHYALSTALRMHGATLTWENVFEAVEEMPEMTERQDVEDETTARRGEGRESS